MHYYGPAHEAIAANGWRWSVFSTELSSEILFFVQAVLHIGNLNIRSDSEGNATMASDKHLTAVSQLLRVEPSGIIKVSLNPEP